MRSKILLLVCTAAMVSCGVDKTQKQTLVKVCETARYVEVPAATYAAKISESSKSNLAFRVSGRIGKIYVRSGEPVRAGQLVAKLDDRDYKIQYNATLAEYNQVKAEIDRVFAMYEDNAVSENDYDKARYGLEQISQKLEYHKNQLNDCNLYAPITGYVDNVMFSQGETVAAGVPVISIFGNQKLSVELNVSYPDYCRFEILDSAYARFTSTPNLTVPLEGGLISRKANANQLYRLQFDIPDRYSFVTPGMTAMVTLTFRQDNSNMNLVPVSSLLRDRDGSAVFLYDATTGTVGLEKVEIVKILNDGNAVVLGLKRGDMVVSAGVNALHDGQKVRMVGKTGNSNPGGLL